MKKDKRPSDVYAEGLKLFFSNTKKMYFTLAPVSCAVCQNIYFNGVMIVYRFNDNSKLQNVAYCNGCVGKLTKYGRGDYELLPCSVLKDFEQLPKDVIIVTNRPIELQNSFISASALSNCKTKDRTRYAGRENVDPNFLEYNQKLMLECEQRLDKLIENEKEFIDKLKNILNSQPVIEYTETKKLK